MFAGQSIEIRHDRVQREDSGGTLWQPLSSYTGSYLRVPPAGAESRSARFIAKPLYHPATDGIWRDDRIDDLSGRLTYWPLFL